MKKNRMMRLASVLLVAVLMTTCTISGTFAKYVTSAGSSDSARVAKFGVTITANGKTFAEAYDTENEKVASTVVSATYDTDDTHLVAPGTSGDMAKMVLSGTPEVDVKVTYVGTFDLSDNWVDSNGDYYCPLEITIKGETTETVKGLNYSSVTAFEDAVKAKIDGYSKTYQANTDLSTKGSESLGISWTWAFEGNDDVKDTFLGDQAAAGNAATVILSVVTTVTQID